ncbi:MAG TPA: post-transcriptional regulator [Pseudogracilibacillus sp.]|nr:post-transcriptional regulator [Pseudogracilibacillus sp.]
MATKPVSEWKEKVYSVLKSKEKEFAMLGYKEIDAEDIWRCLSEHIWKTDQDKRLYEVVQDIFQLQIHTYMDYLAIDSIQQAKEQVDDELMASIHAVMNPEA